jgi:hypothetical protein
MSKTIFTVAVAISLSLAGFFGFFGDSAYTASKGETGTLEKLIVSDGTVSMKLDLGRLNGTRKRSRSSELSELRFESERDALFSIVVFEDKLRGPIPSEMPITPKDRAEVPARLSASYDQLVIESSLPGEPYEFVVRDRKSWFPFFNIEGHELKYEPDNRLLSIEGGRMLISDRFAAEIGRPEDAGAIVGEISISATMRPVEVAELVDGEMMSNVLPALTGPGAGSVPGPDVVVGDVFGLAQFGSSSGSQVGLALGTTSCNYGAENLNWNALPNNDHPVIPQNLYRMSGGASNDERFEQVGQSSVKHAFTALTQNLCALGCNGVGGSRLGSGCSDPYSASLNAGPNLGSRAWINPFDGAFPRGDSASPPNDHSGHAHTGPSHRILTEIADLSTTQNPGATYYAEGQYVTPHEYAWCNAHPGECNMYNNISYRQYSVTGTGSPFVFSPVGSTVRAKSAINAWPGAALVPIEPAAGNDGIGTIAYKVTSPSPGVWHYEYAIYNQNLDRAIQSFAVSLGAGAGVNNVGFHAPPQHPGWSADGTVSNAGYSNAPWTQTLTASEMKWNSETFAQNQNANALRWGTMYNFRFDSNSPPELKDATVGFFKTGAPIVVQVLAPSGPVVATTSVSGRVTTSGGRPVSRAWVGVTGTGGELYWTFSNNFGYFRIQGITPGAGYMIGAYSKEYTFTPQAIDISNNVTGVSIAANP